jgi:succinate-acetate transporter protein
VNFLNYGIYHAIMAWVTLVCVLILHCMAVISEVRENHQNIALAIYYILIAVWLFGILFFYMFNAMN